MSNIRYIRGPKGEVEKKNIAPRSLEEEIKELLDEADKYQRQARVLIILSAICTIISLFTLVYRYFS